MKHEIQKAGTCRIKLAVEASAAEIDPIYKQVQGIFAAKVQMPGFRRGKVPWARIEAVYGKDIQDEINHRVLRKLMEAREEAKVKMAALIDIEALKSAQGEGASATIVMDVEPEVKLPDLKKWQVKKMDAEVTEAEVADRMKEVRRLAASFREATADDVATAEDLVAIDFTSDLDATSLSDAAKPYAANTEYWVQLREDAFLPGLSEVLLGKKLGEQVALTSKYAKEFKIADLAGKKVKYSVTLKAMRKLTPADDAAVLARFGKKDMAELTASITDNLKLGKRYSEEQRATNDLIEAIDKSVKFDLPERVVEERTYDMLAMDPAKPLEQFKEDAAALRKSDAYKAAVDRASKTVRREYTLLALAAERKITLSADEVEGALTRLAQAHNMKKPDLIRRLRENGRLDDFLRAELVSKMVSTLLPECAVL